ncbi:calyx/pep [Cyclophragma undans nucleopolyhedrovirus]|uniref:Calyx/pep n=1 Tax=Cyclophragma undans nucleopolyhedrovirus TaxID=1906244 RepID=A0A288QCZ6_9ABAC|nr:calyx/pep [Cyclophragma undans nucleopolyhedrovirus]AOT85493.1 calyx/pep [Cyclophragma undans nucleopolyhedrovirus]
MILNNNVMFDDASVMWIDTDYIYQNLKIPLSTFQQILFSIPSKHRKMINDNSMSPPSSSSTSCSFSPPSCNTVKYMVDIYGAAVLALRNPSPFSDQLLTTFIANNYINYLKRPPLPPPPIDECTQRQILDALEKIGHQNDLLVNGVNQITLNQSNQFLELSNTLCAVRAQNAQILTTLECVKDTILNRLNALICEIKTQFPDQSAQLEQMTATLLEAINAVQLTLKSELNNTNSILTNLASSITNINTTLNNVLAAIENISDGGGGGGLTDEEHETLNSISDLVTDIKNILMGTTVRR